MGYQPTKSARHPVPPQSGSGVSRSVTLQPAPTRCSGCGAPYEEPVCSYCGRRHMQTVERPQPTVVPYPVSLATAAKMMGIDLEKEQRDLQTERPRPLPTPCPSAGRPILM